MRDALCFGVGETAKSNPVYQCASARVSLSLLRRLPRRGQSRSRPVLANSGFRCGNSLPHPRPKRRLHLKKKGGSFKHGALLPCWLCVRVFFLESLTPRHARTHTHIHHIHTRTCTHDLHCCLQCGVSRRKQARTGRSSSSRAVEQKCQVASPRQECRRDQEPTEPLEEGPSG